MGQSKEEIDIKRKEKVFNFQKKIVLFLFVMMIILEKYTKIKTQRVETKRENMN